MYYVVRSMYNLELKKPIVSNIETNFRKTDILRPAGTTSLKFRKCAARLQQRPNFGDVRLLLGFVYSHFNFIIATDRGDGYRLSRFYQNS